MTDSPVPPPKGILPAQTQQSGFSSSTSARLLDVAVRQAPPALQQPAQAVHIEGRVISSNPQAQELRIATSQGELTLQSSANLPPDTKVAVDLLTQRGVTRANISVIRTQGRMEEDVRQAATPGPRPPAPPLRAGDTAQAVRIAEPPPETETPPQQPVTLPQVAGIIQQLAPEELQQLPQPLPLPPEIMAQIATAGDILAALQNLTASQQQLVLAYAARADVQEALKKFLTPETLASLQMGTEEAAASPDTLDILQAQIASRMQDGAPAASGARTETAIGALLKNLLPLLEVSGDTVQGLPPPAPRGSAQGLVPQTLWQVKVVAVLPPGSPAPALSAGQLLGIAEGQSPAGFPVVRAGDDLFVLKTAASATPGSLVVFDARPLPPQELLASAQAAKGWFHPLLSDDWPALQELLDGLSAAAPNLAAGLREALPAASPRLAPATLFFLAALRTGDVENWLGQPLLDRLRQTGKQALADRLAGDFGKIAAQAKETLPGGWRAMSMPFLHDAQLAQVQVFTRRQGQDKEDDDKGEARPLTRFILNLRLSRMGDMQLDGLVRGKRLDLILRSAEALPEPVRQEIAQAFGRGLSQAALQGNVSFQTRREHWVKIELPQAGTLA